MKPLKPSQRLNLDKIKSRPRTLADIEQEDRDLKSVGKDMPVDYYEGMDGPIPPGYVVDTGKKCK